jgi:hypothetical protein
LEGENIIHHYLTYNSVNKGDLLALIGSHGWLEISVNGERAKIKLNKQYFDQIKLIIN